MCSAARIIIECYCLRYFEATQSLQTLVQLIDSKKDKAVDSLLEKVETAFSSELKGIISTHEYTSLPPFLLPFTSCWLYATLLWKITEYLDKRGDHERASEVLECLLSQEVVCLGSRGRWYERLALNYDYHLKKKEKVSFGTIVLYD